MVDGYIKPCPVCGRAPIVSSTLLGKPYVMCPRHCETVPCATADEAISLWNAGEYEAECLRGDEPPPQRPSVQ